MIELHVDIKGKIFTAYSPSTLYYTVRDKMSILPDGSIRPIDGNVELSIKPTCGAAIVDATRLDVEQLHFVTENFWLLSYHGTIPPTAIIKLPERKF